MYIVTYYKSKGIWYLDRTGVYQNENLPHDPERTGNFARLLELAAEGRDHVDLYLSFQPFPNAEEAVKTKDHEPLGAYYIIRKFCGKDVGIEFWVDRIKFLKEGQSMPPLLYLRRIKRESSND